MNNPNPRRYGLAYGSDLRGYYRLALLAMLALGTLIVMPVLLRLPGDIYLRGARLFHDLLRRILGIKLIVNGAPSAARPTLFVANHSSYADIPVLGSLPLGSFVAKSEIEGWPLFGLLCTFQKTVFVIRKGEEAARQRDELRDRLEAGDNLFLFPEGTSTDGTRVLPFKSTLFASVQKPRTDGRPIMVQPVSVTAVALDDMPLGRMLRPLYAWYGDMTLLDHVWPLLRLRQLTVRVDFHPAVASDSFANRKILAQYCWEQVAGGVEKAISGRVNHNAIFLAPPMKNLAQAGDERTNDKT